MRGRRRGAAAESGKTTPRRARAASRTTARVDSTWVLFLNKRGAGLLVRRPMRATPPRSGRALAHRQRRQRGQWRASAGKRESAFKFKPFGMFIFSSDI
ncbi:hypothetical protein EVAR_92746_1 [Eumeta japonica]|uniref:Uncharacterized protein n=1 Tax=Eumeta variegata TaxID=151549 RepID=A0A4C1SY34_EUMVA|nr:hypothetical protein EVAR_92746_1 [Eumeta japonica]